MPELGGRRGSVTRQHELLFVSSPGDPLCISLQSGIPTVNVNGTVQAHRDSTKHRVMICYLRCGLVCVANREDSDCVAVSSGDVTIIQAQRQG